jgi:hypothetical protein
MNKVLLTMLGVLLLAGGCSKPQWEGECAGARIRCEADNDRSVREEPNEELRWPPGDCEAVERACIENAAGRYEANG